MLRNRKALVALLVCCLLLGVAGVVGADCTHEWGDAVELDAATCETTGRKQKTCNICSAVEYETIPALGHAWGTYVTIEPATCTSKAVERSICSRCRLEDVRETGTTLPHQMTGWKTIKEATCTEDGYKENKCLNCATQDKTEPIGRLGHAWGPGWVDDVAPTCGVAGSAKRECSRSGCGIVETKVLKALEHKFGSWVVSQKQSCDKEEIQSRECSLCNKKETQTTKPALGHKFGSWVVSQKQSCDKEEIQSRECGLCNKKETQTTKPALGHDFGSWGNRVEPTCTTEGSEKRTCSRCGYVDTRKIPMLPHPFGPWGTIDEPSCTKTGLEKRTCTKCPATENRTIPQLPHEPDGVWIDKRQATTKQVGLQVCHCTKCGAEAITRNVAPPRFRYEIPTYVHGPLASQFPGGGASNARVIYLDLTTDSDQRYALVTEEGWLVGYARVTVAGGTVRVSLEKLVDSNLFRHRAWGMFPDVTMVRPVSYDNSLPFDQSVKGPGDSCVITINLMTNYYKGGANEQFSDAMMAPGSSLSYGELNQQMLEMSEQQSGE